MDQILSRAELRSQLRDNFLINALLEKNYWFPFHEIHRTNQAFPWISMEAAPTYRTAHSLIPKISTNRLFGGHL